MQTRRQPRASARQQDSGLAEPGGGINCSGSQRRQWNAQEARRVKPWLSELGVPVLQALAGDWMVWWKAWKLR
jgi:hypothetical protein